MGRETCGMKQSGERILLQPNFLVACPHFCGISDPEVGVWPHFDFHFQVQESEEAGTT